MGSLCGPQHHVTGAESHGQHNCPQLQLQIAMKNTKAEQEINPFIATFE